MIEPASLFYRKQVSKQLYIANDWLMQLSIMIYVDYMGITENPISIILFMIKLKSIHPSQETRLQSDSARLAASITRRASKQTYLTIRLLADRNLAADAYRAYAYFRWVDDIIDTDSGSKAEKEAFIARQQALLEASYQGRVMGTFCQEERMLVDLVAGDHEKNSDLHSYLSHMMAVMVFDLERRGRLITHPELAYYSKMLAIAVTDALHYFIGHDCPAPCSEARYRAVQGAHIIHMLRDTQEDTAAGYYNIPQDYLAANRVSLQDVDSPAYRDWVKSRIQLARLDFDDGLAYIRQVKNWRCRLAGFCYTARFQWLLHAIERDGYRLRDTYPQRKSLPAALWMAWTALTSALYVPKIDIHFRKDTA